MRYEILSNFIQHGSYESIIAGWWGRKRRWREKEEGKRDDELEGIFHKFALKHIIKMGHVDIETHEGPLNQK